MAEFVPARYQPELPLDRLILHEPPDEEAVPMDVIFVGGGPAGLAGAIELARLARQDAEQGGPLGELEIAVLEKAEELGQHCLSGAIVNPRSLRELFPDVADQDLPLRGPVGRERVYLLTEKKALRIPTPPPMRNHGNRIASICEVVRWMGERAEESGVNVFTGFPVASLLAEGDRIRGVRTTPSGLGRDGKPSSNAMPPTDLTAKVVALAEGTRGPLTQAWLRWRGIGARNPQIYALGVKELWQTPRPLDAVLHTMGWPLPKDAFGGSFVYPLEENLVALGLVVGLDYHEASLDVHDLLQRLKLHPLLRDLLEGGELLEWGAKTIPEGGYWSLPERRSGDGVVVLGDAAGFVDVASLKGVHYAIQSGIEAARAIFTALRSGDASAATLGAYDTAMDSSYVLQDLYRHRNMRLAFKKGFWRGSLSASLMTVSGGRLLGGHVPVPEDAQEPRHTNGLEPVTPDGKLTFRKVDAVFKSGNATRDDIPSHLVANEDVPPEVAEFYAHMCPAGVYERRGDSLVINAPNCVDCKATDVLGPRWTPREGGSGPRYKRM